MGGGASVDLDERIRIAVSPAKDRRRDGLPGPRREIKAPIGDRLGRTKRAGEVI
jgi:hypothetical protein